MLVIKPFKIQGLIKFNLFELIKRNGKEVLKFFRNTSINISYARHVNLQFNTSRQSVINKQFLKLFMFVLE